jgi:hypothetical protein
MPKQTLTLIQRLKALGLNDERFRRLHHLGADLEGHIRYCEETGHFSSRTNELVRERFDLVLTALVHNRSPSESKPTDGEWQAATLLAWNRFPFP